MVTERRRPQDDIRALDLYQRACDAGLPRGCYNLAARYAGGLGVVKDSYLARELYERACNGGDALACLSLGAMFEAGDGVLQDSYRARQLPPGLRRRTAGGLRAAGSHSGRRALSNNPQQESQNEKTGAYRRRMQRRANTCAAEPAE
jgi:hypothetical protein